ncbi:MAG: hypothetical protein LBF22_05930 [Deltaproteobacteria bacterium]|jgi:ubiquinone biosynthesis protein|nr:hypothetical protein [Deltaproteobacteria bacterium]
MPSRPFFGVTRAYRHMERVTELVKIMAKFGFGDLFQSIGLGDILQKVKKLAGASPKSPLTRPRRLRLALEEMGLVFIKLGQYLSTRQDILPPEYLIEFSNLQDKVSPITYEEVKHILEESLDPATFLDISPTPLAAASIGQVHLATLASGTEVVVKVKRPGLNRQVSIDLEILYQIATQIEKFLPSLSFIRPVELVDEFKRRILLELNFRLEATNLLHFGRLYQRNPHVKIPALYRSLTTNNTLVMEKLTGVRFDDPQALNEAGIDPLELANITSKIALEQCLAVGLFHGDPHPGNIFAQPGPVVAFMDFGLVGHLDQKIRDDLLKLALGVIRRHPPAIVRSILRLTTPLTQPDRSRLEKEVTSLLENHLTGSLKELNLTDFIHDTIEIMAEHQLRIPTQLLLLAKALIQFENLGLILNSNFHLVDDAGPIIKELYRRRFSPSYWFSRLVSHGEEILFILQDFPRDAAHLLDILKSGRIKADFEIENLEVIDTSIKQASRRIAFALILASLLLSSAVVIHASQPPLWKGFEIIGLLGLLCALILSVWVIFDYIRNIKS